jgi:uncharacterized membrane protein YvbJ
MAMMKCIECGKEISDQARTCPNCGHPSDREVKMQRVQDTNQQSSRVGRVIVGIIMMILAFVIITSIGK